MYSITNMKKCHLSIEFKAAINMILATIFNSKLQSNLQFSIAMKRTMNVSIPLQIYNYKYATFSITIIHKQQI